MYSHLISMVFCTIFVVLFIFYYSNNFFKKEKVKALLLSTVIVIGLVCPFLINILEHKLLGDYIVFTLYSQDNPEILFNNLLEGEEDLNLRPIDEFSGLIMW